MAGKNCIKSESYLLEALLIEQENDESKNKTEYPGVHTKPSECLILNRMNILNWRRRTFFVLGSLFLVYFFQLSKEYRRHKAVSSHPNVSLPKGYVVWSDKCRIKDTDLYAPDIKGFIERYEPKVCPKGLQLAGVVFNTTTQRYVLYIDHREVEKLDEQPDCCFEVIKRSSQSDEYVTYSQCNSFENVVVLPVFVDNILVKCRVNETIVYHEGFPMMPERPKLRKFMNNLTQSFKQKPVSIIMLGIDSVSRKNLQRAMPNTAKYLSDNKWFEMAGYNKMGSNTFPNLMAVLSGYNESAVENICQPYQIGGLDKCPLIWKLFQKCGYATSYAEDSSSMSTFNYLKEGFLKPPVHHYLRPFLLGAKHSLEVSEGCLGSQSEASFVYNYALELESRYRDDPYFGLFWTNSFSHDDVNDCSSMDQSMLEYLKMFEDRGTLNQSAVFFFSDHGMRFGDIRNTVTGYYEDHLPFFYMWLPPWLQNSHPEFVHALNVNKNRLTSPYDLHMTLKHLLKLSGRVKKLRPARSCQKCQSLLKVMPNERSCAEAGIEENWCTCSHYEASDNDSEKIQNITNFAIDHINWIVAAYENGSLVDKCAELSIKNIINARVDTVKTEQQTETHIISFRTDPNNSEFEAVVLYNVTTNEMEVRGFIYRTSSYVPDADCVYDYFAKNYCSCKKIFNAPEDKP